MWLPPVVMLTEQTATSLFRHYAAMMPHVLGVSKSWFRARVVEDRV